MFATDVRGARPATHSLADALRLPPPRRPTVPRDRNVGAPLLPGPRSSREAALDRLPTERARPRAQAVPGGRPSRNRTADWPTVGHDPRVGVAGGWRPREARPRRRAREHRSPRPRHPGAGGRRQRRLRQFILRPPPKFHGDRDILESQSRPAEPPGERAKAMTPVLLRSVYRSPTSANSRFEFECPAGARLQLSSNPLCSNLSVAAFSATVRTFESSKPLGAVASISTVTVNVTSGVAPSGPRTSSASFLKSVA